MCHTSEDNAACIEVANQTTRFAQGPNTFQHVYFIFVTRLKRGSSQLSMSRQNISLPTFLPNLCPAIITCTYVINLWSEHPLHLLTMRECEVFVGLSPKCLPTSIPVLPILLRALLYFLQYMLSFPPIVHLFYLTRFFHPYLFISKIQPGLSIYLWHSKPTSIYN